MPTITLEPQLMEQLNQVATEQALQPEEILGAAVRAHLRQIERDRIRSETDAFRSMHAELVKKHLGQYVAVYDGKVVDHDQDFPALHRRIRQRFGRRPVLLRRVTTEPDHQLVFRSPRFERGRP